MTCRRTTGRIITLQRIATKKKKKSNDSSPSHETCGFKKESPVTIKQPFFDAEQKASWKLSASGQVSKKCPDFYLQGSSDHAVWTAPCLALCMRYVSRQPVNSQALQETLKIGLFLLFSKSCIITELPCSISSFLSFPRYKIKGNTEDLRHFLV